MIRAFASENSLFPSFLFIHNKNNRNTLTRSSIIDRLEGAISVDVLRDAMIKNIEIKDRANSSGSISQTADLINQQKQELEHLEKLEQQRKKDEEDRNKKDEELKLKLKKEVNQLNKRKKKNKE